VSTDTSSTLAVSESRRFPRWLRFFEPTPPARDQITEPSRIEHSYSVWSRRVLLSSLIGYAIYYFVRKNLGIAMPVMERDLHISKSDLGLFLTLHGVIYGISKFINGFFGDRCNARAFMVLGLAASALLNVFFGLSSTVLALGIFWMLNGWFQGMGFPPCARLLTHWFPPQKLATKMSIWNTSHSIGAGVIVVLCGYLAAVNWRLCFLMPAAIAIVACVFLWLTLPDTPASVGLPEVAGTEASAGPPSPQSTFLARHVFSNPYIWLVSLANFFVYTMRYAVLDWGPTLLTQAKHVSISHAGWMVAAFETSGVIGALLAGWSTDRFFGGRAMRLALFYMVMSGVSILLFWKVAGQSVLLNTLLLCACGFFIYGPQCLIGIAAANLATKRAAATAVGLTGLFGYLSTVLSGWGLGTLVQHRGWDACFIGLLIVSAIATVLFALGWFAKPHGYPESD
jgi:phosphoglycerate transporter family protein